MYTGIRFCDIKDLTFANVDYSNRVLTFNQKKTQGHSSKSYVNIPLNDGLLALIGTASTNSQMKRYSSYQAKKCALKPKTLDGKGWNNQAYNVALWAAFLCREYP